MGRALLVLLLLLLAVAGISGCASGSSNEEARARSNVALDLAAASRGLQTLECDADAQAVADRDAAVSGEHGEQGAEAAFDDGGIDGCSSSAADARCGRSAAAAPAEWRRDYNLVLITVDALRIDLGFMGYGRPVSPNLDALAARSTVFDRAYSMASYTGKSVGPTMIGKYASECERDGAHFDTYGPDNTLLAERLHDAGFRTMGAATHWYFTPRYGLVQGMDEWDVSTLVGGPGGPVYTLVTSSALTDVVIRMLSDPTNVQGRFFLWVHYFDPHQRYLPHPEAPHFTPSPKTAAKALYDGEVWYTDHHLGRLLDFIASRPWAERTIIVLTSDHGEGFGEHGVKGHGVDLWEPLVRVPLVVYVPGVEPHRVRVKRSLVDLVPTLLDLLDLPQPPAGQLSGKSMAPEIRTALDGKEEERDVYLDMPVGPWVKERRAVIHGPTPGLKLMHEGGPVYFLFDLAKDPGELHDLAGNRRLLAPVMKALRDKIASLHQVRVGASVGSTLDRGAPETK